MINSPVSSPVFAFKIGHGVSARGASRVSISLVNETHGYFHFQDQTAPGAPLTRYNLTMANPSALGFTSTEENAVTRRFRDVVLAMNLILTDVVLMTEERRFIQTEFSTNETIRETVNFVLRKVPQDQLDEGKIISNLNLIDKIDWHNEKNRQGNKAKHNLAKALNLYERGTNQTDVEFIFRDIFNAAEDAVNSDKHRSGKETDIEFSSLVAQSGATTTAQVNENKVNYWSDKIYNRIKHPDHIKQGAKQQPPVDQLAEYEKAKENASQELIPMREAVNIVILERLRTVI